MENQTKRILFIQEKNKEEHNPIVEMLVLTDEEFLENLEPTGKPHMILKVKLNKTYFNNE